MRIISGTHRGRVIHPPKNLRARPTTDFAKENLFNILANIVEFEGLEVLDLFAGTGSISYEFASRGAASVTPVEINAIHYNFIRKTAAEFGFSAIHPVKANAFLYIRNASRTFDLVFADAPYDLKGSEGIIDEVISSGILREEGILIFEHSKDLNFSGHPFLREVRSYGSVCFSIFEKYRTETKDE